MAGVAEEAFPRSVVPGVVAHRGERVISSFTWGFTPDDGPGKTGHNARLETAADRPAWRDAYARARLILPVAAFVEGRAWFRPVNTNHLAIAGLYRLGPATAEGPVRRATMLTRAADSTVAEYHERMPVLLPADLVDQWLALEEMPIDRLLTEVTALAPEPLARKPTAGADQPSLLDGDFG